ncbi:MAG: hypothetical protein AAF581_22430 [Planctomycetota bacterium]
MIARKLAFATLLCTGLLVGSVASAQFTLEHDIISGPVGGQATGTVTLDNTFGDVQGWSFGVCTDSTAVTVASVIEGSTTATVNGGMVAQFLALNAMPINVNPADSGWTMGVVVDFFSVNSLPIGMDYEVAMATYDLLTVGTSNATFCDVLGTPEVETLIVVAGGSQIPTQNAGTIEGVNAPSIVVDFTAGDATVTFGSSNIPGTVNVTMENLNDAVQGYSFGLTHDEAKLTITDINMTGTVGETSNGGAGPDFFAPTLAPIGGGGATLGVVISLSPPFEDIPTGTAQSIANFVYEAGPSANNGDTVAIDFSGTLGDPAVALVAVVDGNTVDPGTTGGTVTLEESMMVTRSFVRGDANADGTVNIADGVWIINFLWLQGPASPCEEAGNANGQGNVDTSDAMYIFMWRLLDGPAPTGAFPNCESIDIALCAVDVSGCP